MAAKRTKLIVGLFVIGGIAIGILAIIWFGAWQQYFKRGKLYDTFFAQPVDAISRGSQVRYLGLQVGRVDTIDVAPDKRLIEVVLKLNRTDIIGPDTVAELNAGGIIGGMGVGSIELSQRKPGEEIAAPKLTFVSRYPVIPTRRSDMESMLADVKSAMSGFKNIDIQGVTSEIKKTARTAGDFLSDPEMKRTKANMEALTARLDRTAGRIEQVVSNKDFGEIPGKVKDTLARTKELVSRAQKELEDMRLAETAREVNKTVENSGKSVQNAGRSVEDASGRARVLEIELQALTDSLHRTSDDLGRLIEKLNNNPSDLIWGQPVPPRKAKQRGQK